MPASGKRPLVPGGFLLLGIPVDKHGFVCMKFIANPLSYWPKEDR
jgi:hypothetical protein